MLLKSSLCFPQPPVAKKDSNAVSAAHKIRRSDSRTETHTNGSEVHPASIDVSPQVREEWICDPAAPPGSVTCSATEHLLPYFLVFPPQLHRVAEILLTVSISKPLDHFLL